MTTESRALPGLAHSADLSVPTMGREYERVPLAKDTISVSAVQTRVRAVDATDPVKRQRGLTDNLEHFLEAIDKASGYGGRKDLLCFHEFPISGWAMWTREEALSVCIELPGPEFEAVAEKAKAYGCWISFGAYVRDPDWPGHVLSITTLVDPEGNIAAKHWKARNIRGVFPGFELFTTTIENVLDPYVEMYGADAVIPVARTPIGNIAMSSVQRQPELFRALAMKGAEIFVRTASGGFTAGDISMTSVYNGVYSVITNNAVSPGNPGFFEDSSGGSGGTAIYGPRGQALAIASSAFEQSVDASIPIGAFRSTHTIPDLDVALYAPVWQAYNPRYDHSAFATGLPDTLAAAKVQLDTFDRWK